MKNLLTLSLFILLTTMITSAQNTFFPEMGQFFEQGYGDTHNEAAYDIAVLPTGVKAMAGFVEMGTGDKDFGFWFIDSIGAPLLDTNYGSNNNDEAFGIVPFNSNQWILAGYTEVYNSPPMYRTNDYRKDFFILNIDSTGVLQWGVQYGQENYDNIAYSVIADGMDYVYVVGTQTAHIDGSSLMRLMKIDNTGTIIWNYTYNHGGNSVTAYDLMLSNTGNLICTANEYADNTQPAVFEIDSSGAELNYYSFSYSDNREIYGMDTALDGGYVFAGRSISSTDDTNAFVLKTKSDFSTDWSTTLGNSGAEYFKDIVAADFSYIAVGTTNNRGEGLDDVYIVHLDSFGDTLLHETLGGDSVDMGFAIAKFPNMPICYIAGYNTSFGIEETGNAYLGGVLEYNSSLSLRDNECKILRILFVDGFINIDRIENNGITNGSILGAKILGNVNEENKLIEFSVRNYINYLALYDVNWIFEDLNSAISNSWFLKLNNFIGKCNSKGIYCGMVTEYDAKVINLTESFNKNKRALKYNYINSGKLNTIVLEQEFWNACNYEASNGKTCDDVNSYYSVEDHFDAVFNDHLQQISQLNSQKNLDANIWQVHDYISKLYFTYNNGNNNRGNTDPNQATRAQQLEWRSDAIFFVYYSYWLQFLDENGSGLVAEWTNRLKYFGTTTWKKISIFPLFSAESSSPICGNGYNFLGHYLYGPPAGPTGQNDNIYNFRSVEDEYLNQHGQIYSSTDPLFYKVKNIEVNGMAWYCYSCVKDKDFLADLYRQNPDCPDFSKPKEWFSLDENANNGKIMVYPNPSSGELLVNFSDIDQKNANLKIHDFSGKLIKNIVFPAKDINSFDISELGNGIYFISVLNGYNSFNSKIIIVK